MRRLYLTPVCCLFLVSQVSAQAREYFLPNPGVQSYVVILAGASPDKAYRDQIRRWSLSLHDLLTRQYGYAHDHVILLMNGPDKIDRRISGASRRDVFYQKMKVLETVSKPGDQLCFFLIGHGTSDAEDAKFVLTGPDISGQEFAAVLQAFPDRDIVLVNTSSSSFPFCTALTGPGRIVVSATRSRAEKYNTVFAQYFIAALENNTGDRDKNKRVSIWEAFAFATINVEKWYIDQDYIPTEHAMLEDSGDGVFSFDTGPGHEDGRLAQIAYLDPLATTPAVKKTRPAGDEDLELTLNAKIRALERSVFLLRHRKAEVPGEAYQREMERLLIELAQTSRQLRQKNGIAKP